MGLIQDLEDWFIRQTMKPLPTGHPPDDDAPLAFAALVAFLLVLSISIGHCLAK